ncbi:MAG TPA: sialidase family protein [Terracidiphilus sp.]|jgi:hypothetical protein
MLIRLPLGLDLFFSSTVFNEAPRVVGRGAFRRGMKSAVRRPFLCSGAMSAALTLAALLALCPVPANAQQAKRLGMNPPVLPHGHTSSSPSAQGLPSPSPDSSPGPSTSLSSSAWTALGPAPLDSGTSFGPGSEGLVSGRIAAIAADPTDVNTIYAAPAGGGVWKTVDGGSTWTPLTDGQATLAMGAIAVAPSNHLRVYAGTGEANNSEDSNHGQGILVSSDGGATWVLTTAAGAFTRNVIGQIAIDPTNPDVAYAAVGGYPQNGQESANTGIWKTTNAGSTWTNVTFAASLTNTTTWSSVVVDPNTPSIVYAAVGDPFSVSASVYRSSNGGSTWTNLGNPPGGRIALAVSPSAAITGSHVLYVAASSPTNFGLAYFGRSDNADATTPAFANLTSGTPDFLGGGNSGGGQGWYDIAVNVDPSGVVYCAGVINYATGTHLVIRSSNLGVTWSDITSIGGFTPHTDSHAIAFDKNNRMILGSDGGVFRYDPVTPGWTDLNSNLSTIQFVGIGLHPTQIGTVIGGSQDNGTELYGNALQWGEVNGGDGGFAQFSQTNPSHCYGEFPDGGFFRSLSGCTSGTWVNAGPGDAGNFYSPFVVDPTNGDHVLFAGVRVFESTNAGTSWTPVGSTGVHGFNPLGNAVDTVALSPASSGHVEVIYAATGGSFSSSSQIFVTINQGGLWTEVDLPSCAKNSSLGIGCRVNQVVVDLNDPTGNTAIAVTANYSSTGSSHVFRTTNAGTTWTDITANLPNQPGWSAQVDTDPNHTMYVSMEAGVYFSTNPYSTWALYGTGLPNAQGADLELNRSLHALGVGTHGRGAWEIYTPAHITNVSTTAAAGTYGAGAVIPIVVTFTTPVNVSGTPLLTLNTSPTSQVSYSSGSGTNSLTFNYTVGSGQSTAGNLDATSLSLNGGTIADAYSTSALLGLFPPGTAGSLSSNVAIHILSAQPAVITSPAPGSTLTSSTAAFSWTTGTGVTQYSLHVGTTGAGSTNIFGGVVAGQSKSIPGIPTTGGTLYVRLYSQIAGAWQFNDYTYTEASPASTAVMTSPAPGSTFTGSTVFFSWTTGSQVTQYSLHVGTTGAGSTSIFGGAVAGQSKSIPGIPTTGGTVYVRLYSQIAGAWQFNDYTYTEASPAAKAVMTSPAPGSTLTGSTVLFSWTTGSQVTQYSLHVGTTGAGSTDIFGGAVAGQSKSISGIPTTGGTLYVRLYSQIAGAWQFNDYTYTEASPAAKAVITSPAPGSTLTGSTVLFSWTTGSQVTQYSLHVGTTGAGSTDIFGGAVAGQSKSVSGIPTTGGTLYVRLYSLIAGAWQFNDYTYTEQ